MIEETKTKEWEEPAIFHNVPTKWNWVVAYPKGLTLGKNTDIGAFTYIMAKYGVIIEDNVQIGGGCHIYSESTINKWRERIHLKEGCSIGAHSVILPGVIVGKGTSIKAGSVLTKGKYYTEIDSFNTHYVRKRNIGVCEKFE